jgi:hypothetical protein
MDSASDSPWEFRCRVQMMLAEAFITEAAERLRSLQVGDGDIFGGLTTLH